MRYVAFSQCKVGHLHSLYLLSFSKQKQKVAENLSLSA